MATLKEIKGTAIQSRDEDPVVYVGAWAAGGNLNTGRRFLGGTGIQTAALAFGGYTPSYSALTELYNGSSWTETGDLNKAREGIYGFGLTTASVGVGGKNPSGGPVLSEVEEFNGSAWTEVTNVPAANTSGAGAGTLTVRLWWLFSRSSFKGYDFRI